MPQKIASKDVCRQIIRLRKAFLDQRLGRGDYLMHYPYSVYKEDMASEDFISTKVTLASKWRTLETDLIVVYDKGRPMLDLRNLYIRAGVAIPPVTVKGCINTQTEEESE